MTKDHGPSIKDDDTYEALREGGASKEKAARIANAQANSEQHPSEKGASSHPTRTGPRTICTRVRRNWRSTGVRI